MLYKTIVSNFCHKCSMHKYFTQIYLLSRYSECKLLEEKHIHAHFSTNLYVTLKNYLGRDVKNTGIRNNRQVICLQPTSPTHRSTGCLRLSLYFKNSSLSPNTVVTRSWCCSSHFQQLVKLWEVRNETDLSPPQPPGLQCTDGRTCIFLSCLLQLNLFSSKSRKSIQHS